MAVGRSGEAHARDVKVDGTVAKVHQAVRDAVTEVFLDSMSQTRVGASKAEEQVHRGIMPSVDRATLEGRAAEAVPRIDREISVADRVLAQPAVRREARGRRETVVQAHSERDSLGGQGPTDR